MPLTVTGTTSAPIIIPDVTGMMNPLNILGGGQKQQSGQQQQQSGGFVQGSATADAKHRLSLLP